MKKLFVLVLTALVLLSLCACKSGSSDRRAVDGDVGTNEKTADGDAGTDETTADGNAAASKTSSSLPTTLNTMEYALYQNIFYNQAGDSYLGQSITKEGTFTTIQDRFNNRTRYYVWGYNDQTKCCDWQWEFVPKNADDLPANGSFVKMSGTFEKSDDALDGYWFTNGEIQVETVYQGPDCGVDMGTMSATLERVQLINMQVYPQDFEGQTVRIYGRVAGMGSVEHPYYDGAWNQDFTTADEIPAIGKVVTVVGVWKDGVIDSAKIELTDAY